MKRWLNGAVKLDPIRRNVVEFRHRSWWNEEAKKESGCKRVWAYFNNDRDACAIRNAKEFTHQLQKAVR